MKGLFSLLCVFSLIFVSCEQEENTLKTNDTSKDLKFERLTNSPIAYEEEGKIKLQFSDDEIMRVIRKHAQRFSPDLNPQFFNVINIDDNYYLRFYGTNNLVATIALIKDNNNNFRTGDTVCESVACATGGGCVPNGQYCTRCTPPDTLPGGPAGDCKRTTTGFEGP